MEVSPHDNEMKQRSTASSSCNTDTQVGIVSNGAWTIEEEKAVTKKVDFIVMPMLMAIYFTFQLDRANIGFALTDNFMADVGITQDWFNVGQQVLAAGLSLLEIPSNMVLYRVGPRSWISCQIIAWGLAAAFQAFQKGLGAYLSTRLLLGLLEAGFMPAALYTLSQWYKNTELSRRFAVFFAGYILGQAVNGLLAYAILHMRGVGDLAGWQWLFLLEGTWTVIIGAVFACVFPGTPSHPVTFTGLRYFTERETFILQQRIILDDSHKRTLTRSIRLKAVFKTLADSKLWLHFLISLCGAITASSFAGYGPTIVNSFGYDALASNALFSVGDWVGLVLVLIAGYIADRTGRRGVITLVGTVVMWAFAIGFRCLPDNASATTKFVVMTMVRANYNWWNSLNVSWLSINSRSEEERPIRLALCTMAINASLIAGAQTFRSDDRPFYHRGWTIIVGVLSLGVVSVCTLLLLYIMSNRKIAHRVRTLGPGVHEDGYATEEVTIPSKETYNF